MNVSKGTVVAIDYVLRDDSGNLIDQSQEGRPLQYLPGHGNLIPGLEAALEGKSEGDSLSVRLEPEQGYGCSRPEMIQVVPIDRFEGMEGEVQVGMQFHARTQDGVISVRVVKIEQDEVTIDGNHPLADCPLNFEVAVREIRLATEEELAHGHPHQAGGCCGGHGEEEGGCCGEHDHEHGGCCGEGDHDHASGGCCGGSGH
jgi:FKBP-type peptidyl-prolyl cis-trans isomerase SlyD